MKRLVNVLAVFACTMLFTACEYYDHAITDHEDRLGQLENVVINSVDVQIENINTSLYQFETVDSALQALTDSLVMEVENLQAQLDANNVSDAVTKYSLETKIDNLNDLIEELQTKDTELDQKINNLKEYAKAYTNTLIEATASWADTTFATLEQYEAIQTEIAELSILIEEYKSDITKSYTNAIEEAITASEESMINWVNKTLAKSYYNIATTNALLSNLESKLENKVDSIDKAIVAELTTQREALEQAKKDLTAAYESAITEAIEDYNGRIIREIAEAVKTAQDALQSQIDDINSEIEAIWTKIAAIEEDISNIKTDIATIDTQIDGINTSIGQLEKVDSTLQALIDELEAEAENLQKQLDANTAADTTRQKEILAEIANINALIAALQAKDAELDQKIDELEAYVGSALSDTEDWAEATFSTLEQYANMQTEIAAIKALIETYKEEFTAAYTKAIEEATQAVEEAIATSETSMMLWVNETLADGYYDIADINALLAALETKLANADATLAEQIAAQQAALEQAKEDLTTAYEKAIKEAIEENNGKINKEIADAVKAATDNLEAKIAVINNEIETIKSEITNIKESIASINAQITNINASLGQLEEVDAALQTLIDALEAEAEELQNQLDTNGAADAATKQALEAEIANINVLIIALQAKDAELDQKIDALEVYVNGEIDNTKNWAEATFITMEQYAEMQTEIATLTALIDTYKQELTADYTAAITTAVANMQTTIADLEISMKTWVNTTLAEGYYDIAAIDGMLEALETKLADADAALAEQIAAQQAALEQAKEDLTTAYEKAIKEAIEENNGKINKEIADAVKAATDNLEAKIAVINNEIETIKSEITNIKESIASINAQITNINASLGQLEEVDAALQTLIDALEAEAEELQNQLDTNGAADAATKQALEAEIANIKALIAALQAKDTELDKKIDDLKVYVNGEIANTKDWAGATFATLEQYVAIQTEIANLKALLETYKNNAVDTKDIEGAIAASETSMKAWVNKILADGYYDIAAIEAKLTTLATAANNYTDQQLNKAIANQQAALEQAKTDLTAAYQKAIQDAIADNGANNGNFEAQIAAAKAELQNQINAINTQLAIIESRIDALEDRVDALETRIQSIRFVPEYSDGMVDLSSGQATLTFILTPYEAASAIAQEYRNSKGVITAYISRTKNRTRAIDTPQTLTITSVTGNANGILEIGINTNSLPSNYWDDMTNANVYIRINDGNNDIVSEMIPAFESLPTTTTVELVDLGLSVKWASCNVGASSPESYGNYYTWEETKSIEWSGNLRMPTTEEMKELREQCVWKWTKSNGIYGYRISRNGNSIFLPASGFQLNNRAYDSGEYGYYWSTGSSNQANVLEFNVDDYYSNGNEPTYSCTVRPVSK